MKTIGDIEAFLLKINVWLIAVFKITSINDDAQTIYADTSYFLIPTSYNAWLLKKHVTTILCELLIYLVRYIRQ